MTKRTLLFLILATLGLAACQSPVEGEEVASTIDASRVPTDTVKPAVSTDEVTASIEATSEEIITLAKCTVETRDPTPGPTEQSIFAPVSASDWVSGPDTAAVTIIDYSDFQ